MIRIKNMRNERPTSAVNDIRVDRQSVLGNPYKMKNETERDYVCDKYEIYFNNIIENNKEWLSKNGIDDNFRQQFIDELNRIRAIFNKEGSLNLFCWCYPKRCHSSTIRNYLLK